MARDRKELANVTIRLSKHVPVAETLITLLQTGLTLTKRACVEIDSGLSMCGGRHVAAGGGKLHELNARILDLEGGITLVKRRCAWYLRVKLKPHNELPYTESEEFLEVMLMDRRAGVWLVEEGGGRRWRLEPQWSNSS